MISFTTGDLLQSTAYALVNTVNCEGYMGKGLAYQFKVKYPEMNKDYVKACCSHELVPGKLHCYKTEDRLIINFPTKDKWREKSEIDYVTSGLDELVEVIQTSNIKSIAIPPLGCGNGGLIWNEVKQILLQKLSCISDTVDVVIYEPSKNITAFSKPEPQMPFSALLLMNIKFNLNGDKFGRVCLQNTAYFIKVLSNCEHFGFLRRGYEVCDYFINEISRSIKDFQEYYGTESTEEAYEILLKKLISEKSQRELDFYIPYIKKSAEFTNHFSSEQEVGEAGIVLYAVQKNKGIGVEGVFEKLKKWSDGNPRFSAESVCRAIKALEEYGFIEKVSGGYGLKA